MNSTPIQDIVKGDAFSLEGDLGINMEDWKLRCEIYDESGCSIKLATANSGGSDDDIQITDEANGQFVINVASDQTTNFCDDAFIEIEAEDTNGKKFTIHQGEIKFEKQQIIWETPE